MAVSLGMASGVDADAQSMGMHGCASFRQVYDNHPAGVEFVGAHGEVSSPERLLRRHRGGPAFRQLGEQCIAFLLAVHAYAD